MSVISLTSQAHACKALTDAYQRLKLPVRGGGESTHTHTYTINSTATASRVQTARMDMYVCVCVCQQRPDGWQLCNMLTMLRELFLLTTQPTWSHKCQAPSPHSHGYGALLTRVSSSTSLTRLCAQQDNNNSQPINVSTHVNIMPDCVTVAA